MRMTYDDGTSVATISAIQDVSLDRQTAKVTLQDGSTGEAELVKLDAREEANTFFATTPRRRHAATVMVEETTDSSNDTKPAYHFLLGILLGKSSEEMAVGSSLAHFIWPGRCSILVRLISLRKRVTKFWENARPRAWTMEIDFEWAHDKRAMATKSGDGKSQTEEPRKITRHDDGTIEATLTVKLTPKGEGEWGVTTTFPNGTTYESGVSTDTEGDAIATALCDASEEWQERVDEDRDDELDEDD